MDEERSESDVVAQSIGPQEGICEQGCADAPSLRALIDGEARKDENGAWVRTSSRFESLWEVAPWYSPHGQGVETQCLWFLRCDEDARVSGSVVLPRKSVEPVVDLGVARLESCSFILVFKETRFLQN
jgi:hypothetical protein